MVGVTGPRLFVKPSQKSNRVIIINAVSHCCLAGTVNEKTKKEVLEVFMYVLIMCRLQAVMLFYLFMCDKYDSECRICA